MIPISKNGVILYSLILALGVFLWLTGIISLLVYILIFVVCLVGAMKSVKRSRAT